MRHALLALLLSLPAWAGDGALTPGPAPLRLVRAKSVNSTAREEVTGPLGPSKLVPLGFEVGGRLARTRVQKGEVVKTGQLLGQLDPEIADAQVAQAEAAVAAAEAQRRPSRRTWPGATRSCKSEGSVSDVQIRSRPRATSKQAQAQLLAAKAQLAQARAARRRHDLRAPFAGTVVDAPEQVGGMVGPGTPVYIVRQLDPLMLEDHRPRVGARSRSSRALKVRVEASAPAPPPTTRR